MKRIPTWTDDLVGRHVCHERFSSGTVVAQDGIVAEPPWQPERYKITGVVHFRGVGRRRVLLSELVFKDTSIHDDDHRLGPLIGRCSYCGEWLRQYEPNFIVEPPPSIPMCRDSMWAMSHEDDYAKKVFCGQKCADAFELRELRLAISHLSVNGIRRAIDDAAKVLEKLVNDTGKKK